VTPSQKAAVVALAKEKGKRCLAIGDGGNDVSMIQEAHVGVGISGREGLQAARAADYAIGQFRFLARLVLVHGHLSYHRTSFIAQYSFYKSFILAAIQVLYNCFSMFSGVTFFNSLSLVSYNVVFTFLPTFLYALDQHLTTRELSTMAKAYAHSQRSLGLNWKTVFGWYARGITQALILFFFTYGIYSSTFTHKDSGHPIDYASINVVTFTALVSLQTVTMVIESNYMTGFNAFVIIGCYVVYWAFVFVYNTIKSSDFYNVMNMHAGDGVFWLAQLLITTACILPVLAVRYLRLTFWPSLIHAWHIYLRKAKTTSDSFIEMVPMRSRQSAP
jgi:magnesium-transporting ATPase (P-type)